MAEPPTAEPANRPTREQECRFCETARVRIFRDHLRAWVFDAEPITDERTDEFCENPPGDVYVLFSKRIVNRNAGEGQPWVRITGWVRSAGNCSPTVVRESAYLLRLHVCGPWLAHQARRRQERRDAELLGNMRSIGSALGDMFPFAQQGDDEPE